MSTSWASAAPTASRRRRKRSRGWRELAREAVEAGAIGFSTSRTLNHRTSDGKPTPTLTAEADELVGIANGLGRAKRGVLQVVSDFKDRTQEMAMLRRMVAESGRPLSISLVQDDRAPDAWRWILDQIDVANADGLEMRAQVCGRPVGLLFGLELTHNPFSAHAAFREIAHLPLDRESRRACAIRNSARACLQAGPKAMIASRASTSPTSARCSCWRIRRTTSR